MTQEISPQTRKLLVRLFSEATTNDVISLLILVGIAISIWLQVETRYLLGGLGILVYIRAHGVLHAILNAQSTSWSLLSDVMNCITTKAEKAHAEVRAGSTDKTVN